MKKIWVITGKRIDWEFPDREQTDQTDFYVKGEKVDTGDWDQDKTHFITAFIKEVNPKYIVKGGVSAREAPQEIPACVYEGDYQTLGKQYDNIPITLGANFQGSCTRQEFINERLGYKVIDDIHRYNSYLEEGKVGAK
jgi:hypothetical protein